MIVHAQFARAAFQKNVGRFAENADAGPEDKQADGQAEKGINPVRAGHVNDDCANDDGDVRKGVAEIVNQDAAQIKVTAAADESQGDATIHSQRGNGGPDHPAFDHLHRGAKTPDGFITEPKRKQNEDKSIGKRSQSAGAVIAVSLLAVGGSLGPTHGEIADAECRDVRKIVNGVI